MARGFAFSAEAALSFIILIAAAAYLPAFSSQGGEEAEFSLCTDAAGVLVKSGAFQSQEALTWAVSQEGELTGLCISASAGERSASSCPTQNTPNKLTVSFPAFTGPSVQEAHVSCWAVD